MNRNDQAKAAIAAEANPALNSEIEHFLSIDDDEQRPHDYYDALEQAAELAEYNRERAVLTPARRCLIELGVYRIITDEEIARIQTLGGRKYDFQLGGKKYTFEKHLLTNEERL